MSSDLVAIQITGLCKSFEIYENPRDRLKQFIYPKLARFFGRKINNYFKAFRALENVTFEVRKGETIGIIGRNGSGKSTLLQIICGTLSPSSGDVVVNGRVAALLELGSGFNPEFTGRENVYLNASVLGLSKEKIVNRFDEIEQFADIGDFIDQPVKTYSSGMMVRLAFAVVAHVDADILVIDEALAVGDVFFTQKCMRFLRKFMQNGTILFVSHDTSAVTSLCTRAILLNQGKITAVGDPKEISEKYLEDFYGQSQELTQKSVEDATQQTEMLPQVEYYKDVREGLINNSILRNDMQLFQFDGDKAGFGAGGAKITLVQILSTDNIPLSWVIGGQEIILEIRVVALNKILSPIVGFQFKDRLGQILFADNTYLTFHQTPKSINSDQEFAAHFHFNLPILPSGDYSISAAIAEGSQDNHIQHHWIHDALTIKVEASSVCFGLMGIPMKKINLKI